MRFLEPARHLQPYRGGEFLAIIAHRAATPLLSLSIANLAGRVIAPPNRLVLD